MINNSNIKIVDKTKTIEDCWKEALSTDRVGQSRPIPTFQQIVSKNSSKEEREKMEEIRNAYSDLLYGWLLTNGIYDKEEDYYYIPKQIASANKISKLINLSRPTVSAKMKAMLEAGVLIETFQYYKLQVPKNHYFIMDQQTLDFLLSVCKEDVIQVYAIIGGKWKMCRDLGFKDCNVSLRAIAEQLGLAISGQNIKKIESILLVLNLFGLVDWEESEFNDNPVHRITVFNRRLPKKRKLEQEEE